MFDGEPPQRKTGEDRQTQRLALQTSTGVLALFGAVALGALTYRAELEALGIWFVERFGVPGAVAGTFLADSIGFPIPPDVYLVAAVLGGAAPVPLLVFVSLTSVAGGNVAYWIGRGIIRWPWLARRFDWFRRRGDRHFQRWGWAAVALAAWTPLPFSVVCTLAGAFGMPRGRFALSTLHRIPRMIAYYVVIVAGWSLGNG